MVLTKRMGWSRKAVRLASIAGAVVLVPVLSIGMMLLTQPFIDHHLADGHVTELYTYTSLTGERREVTLCRDPLPLTLEDLGVEVGPDAPMSRSADEDRSPLAWGGEYREGFSVVWSGEVPPELWYNVTGFRWTWLRDLCRDRMLESHQSGARLWTRIDDPRWGAEQVYQLDVRGQYLLVYPDRLVNLWAEGFELTGERIGIIAEKLAR